MPGGILCRGALVESRIGLEACIHSPSKAFLGAAHYYVTAVVWLEEERRSVEGCLWSPVYLQTTAVVTEHVLLFRQKRKHTRARTRTHRRALNSGSSLSVNDHAILDATGSIKSVSHYLYGVYDSNSKWFQFCAKNSIESSPYVWVIMHEVRKATLCWQLLTWTTNPPTPRSQEWRFESAAKSTGNFMLIGTFRKCVHSKSRMLQLHGSGKQYSAHWRNSTEQRG